MPTLQPTGLQGVWRLVKPWSSPLYTVSCRLLYIDQGFTTDGASIPRVAWGLVGHPFDERYIRAALLHDALYAAEIMARRDADEEFRAALERDGVGLVRRNLFFFSVRCGGSAVWARHRRGLVEAARRVVRIA